VVFNPARIAGQSLCSTGNSAKNVFKSDLMESSAAGKSRYDSKNVRSVLCDISAIYLFAPFRSR
jgi:hypothetical protein